MKVIETVTKDDFLSRLKIAVDGEVKLANGYVYKVTNRGIEVNGFLEDVTEDKGYFLSNIILLMLQEVSREYECVTILELFEDYNIEFGTSYNTFNPLFNGAYKKLEDEKTIRVYSKLKKFLFWFRGYIYNLFTHNIVQRVRLKTHDNYIFNEIRNPIKDANFAIKKGEIKWKM